MYTAAAAAVIVIFLHSPWTGYDTYYIGYLGGQIPSPFSAWKSHDPLVSWLGFVINLLATLTLIALLLVIALFATRDETPLDNDE